MENLYRKMQLIRQFELTLENYFEKGLLRGTTHGCIGQEAIPVAVAEFVNIEEDFIISTHRGHGHYLAITEDVYGLACEIMGKNDGIINGKGGSQHIQNGNFYTNGITGGMIPTAVGIALAKKLKNEDGSVIAYIGDGGMNEGYVMEALNMASIYSVPILFVLENNNYAMSTAFQAVTGGDFQNRINGFGIHYEKISVSNLTDLLELFSRSKIKIESDSKPIFIECQTFRFCGHSKSDKREYIDTQLEDYWIENDPIKIVKNKIGTISDKIDSEVQKFIYDEFRRAENAK